MCRSEDEKWRTICTILFGSARGANDLLPSNFDKVNRSYYSSIIRAGIMVQIKWFEIA